MVLVNTGQVTCVSVVLRNLPMHIIRQRGTVTGHVIVGITSQGICVRVIIVPVELDNIFQMEHASCVLWFQAMRILQQRGRVIGRVVLDTPNLEVPVSR